MHRGTVIWAAGIGPLVILDLALDKRHDGSTLSEAARYIYRTDNPVRPVRVHRELGRTHRMADPAHLPAADLARTPDTTNAPRLRSGGVSSCPHPPGQSVNCAFPSNPDGLPITIPRRPGV